MNSKTWAACWSALTLAFGPTAARAAAPDTPGAGVDAVTVIASRFEGVWVVHLPLQAEFSDAGGRFRAGSPGEYVDLYCRVHKTDQITVACPMFKQRFGPPTVVDSDGRRVRFEWRLPNRSTLVIDGAFTTPTVIAAKEILELRNGDGGVVAPVEIRKGGDVSPASADSAKAEALLRAAIDDMRQHMVTPGRYSEELADRLRGDPPLTSDELKTLGDIDSIRYLGATDVFPHPWVRNLAAPPEPLDHPDDDPGHVFDVRFAEESRLCRLDVSPSGQIARLDCA